VRDLERFVEAQNEGGIYERAERELEQGHKRSHWMWFVFPQLAGLGHSPTAQFFAIDDLAEAQAYLKHSVLGPRLHRCCELLEQHGERDPVDVFGELDALKLRSSLTLFAEATPDDALFSELLERLFGGPDRRTLELLGG
jgi:uncharacterized protein (DUF1810 family)